MRLKVNQKTLEVNVEDDMPLLWVLRDELGLTGPKYGCGIAVCGACTVHVDGVAVRSCSLRVGDVGGEITTIEGLGSPVAMHACRPHGSSIKWRSADTASPGRSWRQFRC